jgi:hypothetical protein
MNEALHSKKASWNAVGYGRRGAHTAGLWNQTVREAFDHRIIINRSAGRCGSMSSHTTGKASRTPPGASEIAPNTPLDLLWR